jgi:hypothetical protein
MYRAAVARQRVVVVAGLVIIGLTFLLGMALLTVGTFFGDRPMPLP